MEEESGDNVNSKKRSAATATAQEMTTPKRSRQRNTTTTATTARELLQVPLAFIFRKSCNTQQPLLSRTEADCFLRVRSLAHQLDCIVDAVQNARQPAAMMMPQEHPYLRPAAAIQMGIHGQQQQQKLLQGCLAQFATAETTLQQWAEQNWTVAETLRAVVPAVAMEKQHVSDVQDEVCRRIGVLVGVEKEASDWGTWIPMEDYCNRLFFAKEEESVEKGKSASETPPPLEQVSKSTEDEDADPEEDAKMEDVEKPPAVAHTPDDSEEAATMVLTDLLRQTPAREKENDEPPSQEGEESSKEDNTGAPFRSQGAAEVLYGFATTGAS